MKWKSFHIRNHNDLFDSNILISNQTISLSLQGRTLKRFLFPDEHAYQRRCISSCRVGSRLKASTRKKKVEYNLQEERRKAKENSNRYPTEKKKEKWRRKAWLQLTLKLESLNLCSPFSSISLCSQCRRIRLKQKPSLDYAALLHDRLQLAWLFAKFGCRS